MDPNTITIIGSGASGANAALSLLEKGKRVILFDIGRREAEPVFPDLNFRALKENLEDPSSYFLGDNLEALIPPRAGSLYTWPPNRNYILADSDPAWNYTGQDFHPFISHNTGGLAVGWAANCVQWGEEDLRDFPIGVNDLARSFAEASRRINISGVNDDDLSPWLPTSGPLLPPLNHNTHDKLLYRAYSRKKRSIRKRFSMVMGASRLAVDSSPNSDTGCVYCDRCLWGCPRQSIYSPVHTIEQCKRFPGFDYRPDSLVSHLVVTKHEITGIAVSHVESRTTQIYPVSSVLLCAGAIGSGTIFLRTLSKDNAFKDLFANRELKSKSLMDTLSFKIPYVLLKMIGRTQPNENFQFNKLLVGYLQKSTSDPVEKPTLVQGQILSLSSMIYHPLIESMPLGSKTSSTVFHIIKAALGAITFFMPDKPFAGNGMTILRDPGSMLGDRIHITYKNSPATNRLAESVIEASRGALRACGCLVPKSKILFQPNGMGLHYSGTIPMSVKNDPLCVDSNCRSYAYKNLWIGDGSSFPSAPSKSITFNLIANAIRVSGKI